MKDKVILITGATSDTGRETALLFASHGVKVAASGRNLQAGLALVEEIRAAGGEALFIPTDISNANAVFEMIANTQKYFGRLDFAFNNAGTEGTLGPLAEILEKDWDLVMNLNFKGLWLCMKNEIAAMLANKGGVIINTSINLSQEGTGVYTASKAGIEALTKVAATEYGPQGIRVNAVNPSAVDTPMLKRIYAESALEQLKSDKPIKKIAAAKDVAEAVFWLCSPAANHVNGVSLMLDGSYK